MAGARGRARHRQDGHQARVVGAVGVLVAAMLPVALWHDVVADVWAGSSGAELNDLLIGWAPWALMGLGLLCALPVALEHLRDPERRFYSAGTGAWAGWGVTLYLLGFALATQVAQLHALHT